MSKGASNIIAQKTEKDWKSEKRLKKSRNLRIDFWASLKELANAFFSEKEPKIVITQNDGKIVNASKEAIDRLIFEKGAYKIKT
ncbi:MAG: hypothetical protein QME50_06955 [Candidatus Bathyarchaeota archaeon]|nr:hypothetical protein [Candidatus Bathyarchaeota archaeon]